MRILICLVALAISSPSLSAQEKEPSAEETAIQKVLNTQVAAWNKGDLRAFMDGYWNSKELTFYSGKDKRQGWDEAFERYRKRYQGERQEMGKLSFAELEIQLLAPKCALVKGHWRVEMKAETLEGLFTLVMQVKDKSWVIVHDHTSN